MDDVTFRNCAFKDCRFINCDLSLIKLPQTHFRETTFKHCRMIAVCVNDLKQLIKKFTL
jgi:uncharacterized protein YjbI with pentapeptide repeats